jgi:hypothetical protein
MYVKSLEDFIQLLDIFVPDLLSTVILPQNISRNWSLSPAAIISLPLNDSTSSSSKSSCPSPALVCAGRRPACRSHPPVILSAAAQPSSSFSFSLQPVFLPARSISRSRCRALAAPNHGGTAPSRGPPSSFQFSLLAPCTPLKPLLLPSVQWSPPLFLFLCRASPLPLSRARPSHLDSSRRPNVSLPVLALVARHRSAHPLGALRAQPSDFVRASLPPAHSSFVPISLRHVPLPLHALLCQCRVLVRPALHALLAHGSSPSSISARSCPYRASHGRALGFAGVCFPRRASARSSRPASPCCGLSSSLRTLSLLFPCLPRARILSTRHSVSSSRAESFSSSPRRPVSCLLCSPASFACWSHSNLIWNYCVSALICRGRRQIVSRSTHRSHLSRSSISCSPWYNTAVKSSL